MTKDELEMMKRTNEPSVKMQLQVILQSILQQQPNTEQFIKAMENKGVNVLFNQASTGFVSGISYEYKGLLFKGASLGNAYKWTNIKNTIGYEQERDRATIYEANTRTKSLNTNLRAGTIHNSRNTTTLQQNGSKRQLSVEQSEDARVFSSGHSIQSGQSKQPARRAQRKNISSGSSFQETSKTFTLASLLDGRVNGNLIHTPHQPNLDNSQLNQYEKKKKRRRGRRI